MILIWRCGAGKECGRASSPQQAKALDGDPDSHDAHLSAMKLREDGAPGFVALEGTAGGDFAYLRKEGRVASEAGRLVVSRVSRA